MQAHQFLVSCIDPDVEDTPLSKDGFHLETTVVILNDALTDGQAKPDPSLLCCKKGLENIFDILSLHPLSRIPDGQTNRFTGITCYSRRPENQSSAIRHGFNGVVGNIQNHLDQLFSIDLDKR